MKNSETTTFRRSKLYREDELLPISALQHLVFCKRQCALIHLEQTWVENRYTAEGRVMHERVHEKGSEKRKDKIIARGLYLRSLNFGIVGISDVVEFYLLSSIKGQKSFNNEDKISIFNGSSELNLGTTLPGREGLWVPYPVEYKRGKKKKDSCDEVQLCAQALCLEETLKTYVPSGSLFYGQNKRRQEISFDFGLRKETAQTIEDLHSLLASEDLPPPEKSSKCKNCSLRDVCMPEVSQSNDNVESYIQLKIRENLRRNS